MSGCPIQFDPLSPEQLADPYPLYARMRTEAPVFYDAEHDLWVVTRHADVMAAVRDPDTFSSQNAVRASVQPLPEPVQAVLDTGWPLSPTLTDSDGAMHRRLRGLVGAAFTPRRIAALEPRLRECADEIIDGFVGDGRVDIIDRFGLSLPLMALTEILGVPPEDLPALHRWSYNWLRLMQATDPVDDLVRFAHDVVDMQRYFMEALKARTPGNGDLMSALLASRADDEEPLSMVEAMRVPMNLIIAGHVTVTRAIGNGITSLLSHPDQLAQMREDPVLVPSVVEELLRYESPAQGLFRTVRTTTQLGGVTLPAGARVMLHWGAANRDETVFERPDELDVSRDVTATTMAFGKGVHACLGAPLARLELQIALPRIFERLPGLRLVEGGGERDTIFFARGFRRLEVAWDVPETQFRRVGRGGAEYEIPVHVVDKEQVADGVVALKLADTDGRTLPEWAPGAHVDLALPNGITRQYSLCGDPHDQQTYRVGVLDEPESRGGSRHIYDELQVADVLTARGPRNHFALRRSPRYIFIAGGIGITPLLPMVAVEHARGADWQLIYGGRSRASMAFTEELETYGDHVTLVPEDEAGLLDLEAILGNPQDDTLVYCCGPEALLEAVEVKCEAWPHGALRVERFSPKPLKGDIVDRPFEVDLLASGITLNVEPGQSIVELAEDAGAPVLYSCSEGTCGSCETSVIEGTPEHRDSVLNADERARNDRMMICVSRCMSDRLVLDL